MPKKYFSAEGVNSKELSREEIDELFEDAEDMILGLEALLEELKTSLATEHDEYRKEELMSDIEKVEEQITAGRDFVKGGAESVEGARIV